ncbi:unnamed protein product [Choristocarpus tenellus]
MPRQTTRSAGRGALDQLRAPVRSRAEEVFSVDNDRSVLKDEPLMSGLSELQTKQALKVLDTYSANVQRQGSGKIQNKAAYLMSLIQSCKLGLSTTTVSSQRLVDRMSPVLRRAVEGVFDPVTDRVVLEDRALMELLAKVPEQQALTALKKYRATVQHRGRDAINNKCGYLIGFLKQYQESSAAVTSSNTPAHSQLLPMPATTTNSALVATAPIVVSSSTTSFAAGLGSSSANCTRSGVLSGSTAGHRPISFLQPAVRKQLEKVFESGKDRAVLEDVGLIKQLARLGEEQALAALKNYREASKHRSDINNKSAYLMGILRGYIEGTTPIAKVSWEETNDPANGATPGQSLSSQVGKARGRGRGRSQGQSHGQSQSQSRVANDREQSRGAPTFFPEGVPVVEGIAKGCLSLEQQLPMSAAVGPQGREAVLDTVSVANAATPLSSLPNNRFSWSSLAFGPSTLANTHPTSSALQSGLAMPSHFPHTAIQRGGLSHDGVNREGVHVFPQYNPSRGLFVESAGPLTFGINSPPSRQHLPVAAAVRAEQQSHLFGSVDDVALEGFNRGQILVGPGLLGGDIHNSEGGSACGGGGGGPPSGTTVTRYHSQGNEQFVGNTDRVPEYGLFGSGLLSIGGAPSSPASGSVFGSSSLSGAGSGSGSPATHHGHNIFDRGQDTTQVMRRCLTPSPSPEEDYAGTSGVKAILARLNLDKYVPVLAEAEVDINALRLFGEEDLKDLGFPKGPRIKLLHEVQNLKLTMGA